MKGLVVFALAIFPVLASAQQSKVYLDPQDAFTSYFTSALEKKSVPVIVTTDPTQADYTVRFQTKDSNGSLLQGIATAVQSGRYDSGAFNEVGMTVIDVKSKDVAFSYTCKKYDQYTSRDSQRASSVAECLAKHWKNKLNK
ncbi:MAG TPA: hypothetical protein VE109_11550 [Acidobacteriaceae bacterium]|nr:hypothetical protein [Acidobacteriaceae bacterium]